MQTEGQGACNAFSTMPVLVSAGRTPAGLLEPLQRAKTSSDTRSVRGTYTAQRVQQTPVLVSAGRTLAGMLDPLQGANMGTVVTVWERRTVSLLCAGVCWPHLAGLKFLRN
jgi:hypothetical protein